MKKDALRLEDARWQKKDAEVFQRYGHLCAKCGSVGTVAYAHHRFLSDPDPWDIPHDCLWLLCDFCADRTCRASGALMAAIRTLSPDAMIALASMVGEVNLDDVSDSLVKDARRLATHFNDRALGISILREEKRG